MTDRLPKDSNREKMLIQFTLEAETDQAFNPSPGEQTSSSSSLIPSLL
jgi:hypothetical protein